MAPLPVRAPREANRPEAAGPRERRRDTQASVEVPRVDRRVASGCLWDACEALLQGRNEPDALANALDALQRAFECDGVALHAIGASSKLEPWCARGDWSAEPGDMRECMGVPLFRGRERIGALDLRGRKGQRWSPEQLALVRTASGALGAALGARLELERLRREPGRDTVTGLGDAHAFRQRLFDEAARAEREGQPVSVVLVDIDHFQAVVEKYGPAVADAALAEAALVMKLAMRDGDYLARTGDDTFAAVLGDCDVAPARRLADRLRHALEDHRFARIGRLTASAGVASGPRDGGEALELLTAAERALALAKKGGRRRTASSGPTTTH